MIVPGAGDAGARVALIVCLASAQTIEYPEGAGRRFRTSDDARRALAWVGRRVVRQMLDLALAEAVSTVAIR